MNCYHFTESRLHKDGSNTMYFIVMYFICANQTSKVLQFDTQKQKHLLTRKTRATIIINFLAQNKKSLSPNCFFPVIKINLRISSIFAILYIPEIGQKVRIVVFIQINHTKATKTKHRQSSKIIFGLCGQRGSKFLDRRKYMTQNSMRYSEISVIFKIELHANQLIFYSRQ